MAFSSGLPSEEKNESVYQESNLVLSWLRMIGDEILLSDKQGKKRLAIP